MLGCTGSENRWCGQYEVVSITWSGWRKLCPKSQQEREPEGQEKLEIWPGTKSRKEVSPSVRPKSWKRAFNFERCVVIYPRSQHYCRRIPNFITGGNYSFPKPFSWSRLRYGARSRSPDSLFCEDENEATDPAPAVAVSAFSLPAAS